MVSLWPFGLLLAATLSQAIFALSTASASHILVLNDATFTDKILTHHSILAHGSTTKETHTWDSAAIDMWSHWIHGMSTIWGVVWSQAGRLINRDHQRIRQPIPQVKEKDTLWFVKFCVPWCKHCARADLVWEELGGALDTEDSVEIGQVDCTSSKATCSKVGIRSYPTLKLFYDGEEYKTYTGKRELLDLKKFASEAALELSKEGEEEA